MRHTLLVILPTCCNMVDTSQLFLKLARGASFKKDDPNAGFLFKKQASHWKTDAQENLRRIKRVLDFFGDEEEENQSTHRKRRASNDDSDPAKRSKVTDFDEEFLIKDETEEYSHIDAIDDSSTSGDAPWSPSVLEVDYDNNEGGTSDVEEGQCSTSVSGDEATKEKSSFPQYSSGIQLFSDQHSVINSSSSSMKTSKKTKKKIKKLNNPLKLVKGNKLRYSNRIFVSGDDIPDPISNFDDIKDRVPSNVLKNLVTMGYDTPTPVQMQVIPLLLEGREILACAPTGSGKTAAFGIPIIAHLKEPMKGGVRAIIVCPTRELALQTQREFGRLCKGTGFRVNVITGEKTASIYDRTDILVTTPIRLIKLLENDAERINVCNIQWLIFDECDKLFEDGLKGFKKQIGDIYSACDNPGIIHALFSATLTTGVEQFCQIHLDSFVQVTIGKVNTTADIKQELLFVGQEDGKLIAVRDIIRKGFTPPVLIFVQSVERAKHLFHELIYDGVNVDVIHSERTQAQRDNVVKCFREGKIWVLICTDLMGRGIDFKGVNLVINYDFPPNAISYIHRIGRTGRAGRKGEAVTLFTEDDISRLRSIASVMRNSGCTVPDWMLQLKKPSKTTRKTLAKKSVMRKDIRTISKYDLERSKKKREIILASKRRRLKQK